MRYSKTVLAFALSVLFYAHPLAARQDDQRLDILFASLTEASDKSEAKSVEQAIWHIWLLSGNDTEDLLMFQGVQQMRQGAFKQAAFLFTAIIEMDPKFAEAWNKRATVRFLMGDLEGSIDDVVRALELEPRHFGALAGLGQIYEKKKDVPLAITAFEKAVAINPHMTFIDQKLHQLRIKRDSNKI